MYKNPRISFTLPSSSYASVARFAAINNTSMSKVVASFINEVSPQLDKMSITLEALAEAKKDVDYKESKVRADLVVKVDESIKVLEDAKLFTSAQLDLMNDSIEQAFKGGAI
jgi:hypothetical protein